MPSPYLLRNFIKGATYHLVHRARPDQPLFTTPADYQSFILTLSYYLRFPHGTPLSWVPRMNAKTLAAKQGVARHAGALPVIARAFLLLPDHFHLLLTEQHGLPKAGISELMRRLSVGYAMTYRKVHGGSGAIYRGKYKMVRVPNLSLPSLVKHLHTHPNTNPTYLKDPLHSSLSDYLTSPRSWLSPLSTPDSPSSPTLGSLTLD